jgi:predicted acyltransferase
VVAGALTPAADAERLVSLDAYRGCVMLLLFAVVLRTCEVAAASPGSRLWAFLCHHQSHVPWAGASLHDLIQPSFSFLVGAALPFSLAARTARGDSPRRQLAHAAWRALLLIGLGIWLRSFGHRQTYYTFEDTLTQIGLGYLPLFLLARRSAREQWAALAVILAGYWAALVAYPAPGPGLAAHFEKNTNLFPREQPFVANRGGYATLSFVPTLGTMILGLLAGAVLRGERAPRDRMRWLAGTGAAALAAGFLLGALGLGPVVKRIWTPSFTLWSGGVCLLISAAAYWLIDVRGRRGWAFPLVVLGTNSIAAYCLYELFAGAIAANLLLHFGEAPFRLFGDAYRPFLLGLDTVCVMWLMLFWMYRRRIFVRL